MSDHDDHDDEQMVYIVNGRPMTKEQAERHQMAAQAFEDEITEFLAGLPPRHAFLLMMILRSAAEDSDEGWLQAGRLRGLLDFVHKVDPNTGLPFGQDVFGGEQK